ncbi:hypothetical protein GPL15_10360 [Clostridium sp. MCC353]|uniref:hypothetical protein n=1 Tax=Clostridium sp. MCC353 TaxID=2592646 RepID=UPI001C01EBE0|nr:hypothetical protein [Clostridium sp. MCC353]MBT9776907.1 hypothetical protein [Clostridium sp. MCC353]
MRTLFPKQYDMISELAKLEKLMPSYTGLLRKLSIVIRNKVWKKSDEKRLAVVLGSCNQIFKALVDTYGDQIEILEMYVEYLTEYKDKYSGYDLSVYYNSVQAHIQIFKTQNLVKEHWRQINPYFRKEYAKEDLLSKDLTEILDDFFDNIVRVCPEEFFVTMNNKKLKFLSRGRRGIWDKKEDLAAPSIEIAKKNNIINRWNPPDRRYLYLTGKEHNGNDVETISEELRAKTGETITVASFKFIGDNNFKILDLDYETITRQEIFNFVEDYEKNQVKEIISKVCTESYVPTKNEIMKQIKLRENKTVWLANTFVGKLLLKELCDAIFVPLDDNLDNEEKDKCYKSFHILAEYLEKRGYKGICYPSTRMRLIGKTGRNIVLFDADSAEAIEESFETFVK